jgi:hypothetical protein
MLTAIVAAALGILSLAVRWTSAEPRAETIFIAVEVQGEDGGVIARPMLVGEDGKRLRVHLRDPLAPERDRLTLVLDPTLQGADVELDLELALPGRPTGKGKVQLRLGAEQTVEIGKLSVALYAARVPSDEFDRYLKSRRIGPPTT